MSWVIAKPTQKSLKYQVFSTIVMDYITKKMYRAEMLEWLKNEDRCEGFYDPRPLNVQYPDFDDQRGLATMYWNGSFWYATEEDGYWV